MSLRFATFKTKEAKKPKKGTIMKTTSNENLSQKNDTTEDSLTNKALVAKPLKSLRPMKSMVKTSSLRPQRIQVGAKLRRKAIKA